MIYTVFYCIAKSGLSNQNERQSLIMAQAESLNLPLKRNKDEERDGGVWQDPAISGLDKGERKEERRGKRKAVNFFFFTGLKVKTELTTEFLYLPSYIFSSPGRLEGPVIHGYPCSFLGSFSAQCFSAHSIHLNSYLYQKRMQ